MNVVIAGAGKVGYYLAKELMIDNDVTIIDQNEMAIENIENSLDVLSICGNVEDPYTYRTISEEIDLFIAVTNSDEVNLLSSLIIDNITQVKKKVVRLKNHFFKNDRVKQQLGISHIITPALQVAKNFNNILDFPHVNNIKNFYFTKAFLLSIRVKESIEPKNISKIYDDFQQKAIVCGIERDGTFFIPSFEDYIIANDLVYFLAFASKIEDLKKFTSSFENERAIENCVIYGANDLGVEIAKVLSKKNINIKIVDKKIENCKIANRILKNKAEVIKNNYNLDSLLEQSIENIDIFISATNNDEFNIAKCLEAKDKNIQKIIGIHNNLQYAPLMRKLGIEVIRGEKMATYHTILEKIISHKNLTTKRFCGGEGTISLLNIDSSLDTDKLSRELKTKNFKNSSLFVIRDKKIMPYKDATNLQEDDLLIINIKTQSSKDALKCLSKIY